MAVTVGRGDDQGAGFTKTPEYRHESIDAGVAALAAMVDVDATEDADTFTSANLGRYPAAVFRSAADALPRPSGVRYGKLWGMHLRIARNPDPESRLGYLLHIPLGAGLMFRTSGLWPRTNALYCHPMALEEWPADAEIVEEVPLRSCVRRGAAIDLVLDRGRENRSQIVFTTARGREVVFWQSPRTRKQARPTIRVPTARAAGLPDLHIIVDSHEQYPYRFSGQQVRTARRALPAGDYGLEVDGRLVAAAERKSLTDLIGSLVSGKLRFAVADLAALPRGAVVVEDRYSQVFHSQRVRPALIADGLAELQVRWPEVPIVFCETRSLAEEWVYRYLAAAYAWATTESAAGQRLGPVVSDLDDAPPAPAPATAEVRAWARQQGLTVPDRGRLAPDIWAAWHAAHGAIAPG